MSLLSFTPLSSTLSIVRRPLLRLNSTCDFLQYSPVSNLLSPPLPSSVVRFQVLYREPDAPRRASYGACAIPVGAGDVMQDAGAAAVILVGGYGLVFTFDGLTHRNFIQQSLSRKLVHILSGLLFMFSWPIFSTSINARYFASMVPLVNCIRLLVHGLSLVSDEGLIKSVTRDGNPKELLRGPLYYVLVLTLCALVFWRESPIGVISLSMMCAGDGVADIMGRTFGSVRIPYNQRKSWVGSISMFFFGFLISIGMLYYYSALGYFQLDWSLTLQRVALVSLVATIVESLPISEVLDDNLSVPFATMVAAYFSFKF